MNLYFYIFTSLYVCTVTKADDEVEITTSLENCPYEKSKPTAPPAKNPYLDEKYAKPSKKRSTGERRNRRQGTDSVVEGLDSNDEEDDNHEEDEAHHLTICHQKLISTIRLSSDMFNAKKPRYIVIDHAYDAAKRENVALYTPIALSINMETVQIMYPIKHISSVNAAPYEIVMQKDVMEDFPGCKNNGPYVGVCRRVGGVNKEGTDEDEVQGQGFCCSCTHGNSTASGPYHVRGGQDCTNSDGSPLPSSKTSAHCLKFDPLWYSVNRLDKPVLHQRMQIAVYILADVSTPPKKIDPKVQNLRDKKKPPAKRRRWVAMHSSQYLILGTDHKSESMPYVFAHFLGLSYAQTTMPLDFENQRVLIPEPLSQGELDDVIPMQLKSGPENFLVLPLDMIDSTGSTCNKVGINANGFLGQKSRCNQKAQSCLQNQPSQLWSHDMLLKNEGKRTQFFLGGFGKLADTPVIIHNRGHELQEKFISFSYEGNFATNIGLEVNADKILFLHKGSHGIIESVNIYHGKSAMQIIVHIFNSGLVASQYSVKLVGCHLAAFTKQVHSSNIAPQDSVFFIFDATVSVTADMTVPICNAVLYNHKMHPVAQRKIKINFNTRTICMGYCKCQTMLEGLSCKWLEQKDYNRAGYRGPLIPLSANLENLVQIESAVVILVMVYVLFILGIIKCCCGLTFSRAIGELGLTIFKKSILTEYYERDIKCHPLVYNEKCEYIHPFTGQRVRQMNLAFEIVLNMFFFFILPLIFMYWLVCKVPCMVFSDDRIADRPGPILANLSPRKGGSVVRTVVMHTPQCDLYQPDNPLPNPHDELPVVLNRKSQERVEQGAWNNSAITEKNKNYSSMPALRSESKLASQPLTKRAQSLVSGVKSQALPVLPYSNESLTSLEDNHSEQKHTPESNKQPEDEKLLSQLSSIPSHVSGKVAVHASPDALAMMQAKLEAELGPEAAAKILQTVQSDQLDMSRDPDINSQILSLGDLSSSTRGTFALEFSHRKEKNLLERNVMEDFSNTTTNESTQPLSSKSSIQLNCSQNQRGSVSELEDDSKQQVELSSMVMDEKGQGESLDDNGGLTNLYSSPTKQANIDENTYANTLRGIYVRARSEETTSEIKANMQSYGDSLDSHIDLNSGDDSVTTSSQTSFHGPYHNKQALQYVFAKGDVQRRRKENTSVPKETTWAEVKKKEESWKDLAEQFRTFNIQEESMARSLQSRRQRVQAWRAASSSSEATSNGPTEEPSRSKHNPSLSDASSLSGKLFQPDSISSNQYTGHSSQSNSSDNKDSTSKENRHKNGSMLIPYAESQSDSMISEASALDDSVAENIKMLEERKHQTPNVHLAGQGARLIPYETDSQLSVEPSYESTNQSSSGTEQLHDDHLLALQEPETSLLSDKQSNTHHQGELVTLPNSEAQLDVKPKNKKIKAQTPINQLERFMTSDVFFNYTKYNILLMNSGDFYSLCGRLEKAGELYKFSLGSYEMQVCQNINGESRCLPASLPIKPRYFRRLLTEAEVNQYISELPRFPCLNRSLSSLMSMAETTSSLSSTTAST